MSVDRMPPIAATRWQISEATLIPCINWAMISGELPIGNGELWEIKRSETEQEKEIDPEFILIVNNGVTIYPAPCLIELGIRTGCLEDRGESNTRYELIP